MYLDEKSIKSGKKKVLKSLIQVSLSLRTVELQVLVLTSHGNPVSVQCGPRVFGETSPSFELTKAATNLP